jgi:hypothetical protein
MIMLWCVLLMAADLPQRANWGVIRTVELHLPADFSGELSGAISRREPQESA